MKMMYRPFFFVPLTPISHTHPFFFSKDILAGITHTKHGNVIANQHRKKQAFLGSRLAGYVVSTLHPSGISFIKGMTDVERHAELLYAESMFEKALLGIVYSGDWLAFIKEACVSLPLFLKQLT